MRFVSLLVFLPLLILTNCSKEPKASFHIEEMLTYNGSHFCYTGQTIRLVNTSEEAENYTWEFPNGSISHEKNPSYTISANSKELSEEIILTASNKRGKKANTANRSYFLYLSNKSSDFFTIDTTTLKPYLKFIYPLSPDQLYSFRFIEESINPRFEGRVLFKGTFPVAGEYLIAAGSVSVEVTKTGYTSLMPYTSKAAFGGTVNLIATPENRLRMTFDQVKVSDTYKNEIFTSADLVY